MQELKTPITKAMFAIEVLEESKSKQILNRAFLRMNEIIKELATVEKTYFQSTNPRYSKYLFFKNIRYFFKNTNA